MPVSNRKRTNLMDRLTTAGAVFVEPLQRVCAELCLAGAVLEAG